MKKCPYCAEEIQEDAKKCKHCGEWFDQPPKPITHVQCVFCEKEIDTDSEKCQYCGGHQPIDINSPARLVEFDKRNEKPEKKKSLLIYAIPLAIILWLFIFYNIDSSETESQSPQKRSQKTSGSNQPYFAGHNLGSRLAKQHYIYKGSAYIESECNGLVDNYLGRSSNSGGDYMFIQGCINGYKEAFGKR